MRSRLVPSCALGSAAGSAVTTGTGPHSRFGGQTPDEVYGQAGATPYLEHAPDVALTRMAVRLVSITQKMGDDPTHVMMRQIMALFDEYRAKENAKHVLHALKENARQGF